MLKRLGLALRISLCLSASTYALAAETFRVLSYNVENLWDDEPDNTPSVWRKFLASIPPDQREPLESQHLQYKDYSDEYSNWYTPDVLDAKIEHLVETIRIAGEPEILVLQEIESAGNDSKVWNMRGRNFVFRKEFEKLGYRYFILGHQASDNPVSVTQAIISKLPLKELPSVNIAFEDDRYSMSGRDVQVVEFKSGSNRMLIFNNHWKSKRGGKKTELVRIKTAELVKQRIAEERKLDPDTRVIVAGDLNSAYYEAPILVLASSDESAMLKEKTQLLYNTWYEVSEEDRWETSFRGERQTLSAMLISDDFYFNGGIQYIDQSFHVIGQSGSASKKLLNADGTPFRWQTQKGHGYTTHIGEGYSDHLPLLASFKIEDTNVIKSKVKLNSKSYPETAVKKHMPDKVPLCTGAELIDIEKIDFKAKTWFGKCIKIEGHYAMQSGKNPDENNFIQFKDEKITLAMTRSWDPRPNIDDSRVTPLQVHSSYTRSNKCFHRNVLRGKGGVLKKAVGRLGYNDGHLTIFVASREEKDIVLSDLPELKKTACPWN